jgi:lysophospholipase L1-like esterase
VARGDDTRVMAQWKSNVGKSIVLAVASSAFALAVIVGADRLVGSRRVKPLIFTPNSAAVYETFEFRFTSRINRLGFRDRDFSVGKSSRIRVLAFGDSTTFGWGSELEDTCRRSWKAPLGRKGSMQTSRTSAHRGPIPEYYADLAEAAIPLLRPDLVLVAIPQGDDLEQTQPPPDGKPARPRHSCALRSIGKLLVGNLWSAVAEKAGDTKRVISIQDQWRAQAQDLLTSATAEQVKRMSQLEEKARDAFAQGKLNPWLVWQAVTHPDYMTHLWDPKSPEAQQRIHWMSSDLRRLGMVAREYDARVLVSSMPTDSFVERRSLQAKRRLGFLVNDDMLASDAPDQALSQASAEARLPFTTVTDAFRAYRGTVPRFYEYDGHLTPAGNRLFAESLLPMVREALAGRRVAGHDGRRDDFRLTCRETTANRVHHDRVSDRIHRRHGQLRPSHGHGAAWAGARAGSVRPEQVGFRCPRLRGRSCGAGRSRVQPRFPGGFAPLADQLSHVDPNDPLAPQNRAGTGPRLHAT